MNLVLLIGNVGRDPEIRSTQGGDQVATFSLATSRRWKDRSGERKEEVTWHQVIAWKNLAEIVGQYVSKGSRIAVRGRLQEQKWKDRKSGEDRSRMVVIADEVELLGGNRAEPGEDRPKSGYQAAKRAERPDPTESWGKDEGVGFGDPYGDDSDIPF